MGIGNVGGTGRLGITPNTGVGWMMRGEDGSLPTLDLDFAHDRYFWAGARKLRSDLIVANGSPTWDSTGLLSDGADRLQVTSASIANWFNWDAGTLYVEWYRSNNAAGGYICSIESGTASNRVRIELGVTTARAGYLNFSDAATFYAANSMNADAASDYGRTVASWGLGDKVRAATRGILFQSSGNLAARTAPFPTTAAIGYNAYDNSGQLNGWVRRIVFWPKKFTVSWITTKSVSPLTVHVIGDSFVNSAFLQAGANQALSDDRTWSMDGVGGSTLTQQAARFAATPQYWDRTLVIMDGGLDTDAATSIAAIDDMVGRLSHSRWLYVEPSPAENAAGSAGRIAFDAVVSAIRAHVGEAHFVPTLSRALALGDGGANDLADIAANIWPRSLRTDTIHPTTAAWGSVIGYQLASALHGAGW